MFTTERVRWLQSCVIFTIIGSILFYDVDRVNNEVDENAMLYLEKEPANAPVDNWTMVWLQFLDKVTDGLDRESQFPNQAGHHATQTAPSPRGQN